MIKDFDDAKEFMLKRFKKIKDIYRNESKKGIYTTVVLKDGTRGTVRLMDGDNDDVEKAILWAYIKAVDSTPRILGFSIPLSECAGRHFENFNIKLL